MQFENQTGTFVQDGKLISNAKSFYMVDDLPPFARARVMNEANRQIQAASANGYKVEWLVSDAKAASQLWSLFQDNSVNIRIRLLPKI